MTKHRARIVASSLAVLSIVALSACGEAFESPAAVVDGEEISIDTLQEQLDLVLADPQFASQVRGPEGDEQRKVITRQLLAVLIQQRIIERYARDNGISVDASEVEERLQQAIEQTGGRDRFDQELRSRGLTLADVRRNIERSVLVEKVRQSVSGAAADDGAGADDQNAAFVDWLRRRIASADIEVNPRFGHLDSRTGEILPITSTDSLR